MISEKEIMALLNQVIHVEESMEAAYLFLAENVSAEEYRSQFKMLASEEVSHAHIVKLLLEKIVK